MDEQRNIMHEKKLLRDSLDMAESDILLFDLVVQLYQEKVRAMDTERADVARAEAGAPST
jgi:hypothetical protein